MLIQHAAVSLRGIRAAAVELTQLVRRDRKGELPRQQVGGRRDSMAAVRGVAQPPMSRAIRWRPTRLPSARSSDTASRLTSSVKSRRVFVVSQHLRFLRSLHEVSTRSGKGQSWVANRARATISTVMASRAVWPRGHPAW